MTGAAPTPPNAQSPRWRNLWRQAIALARRRSTIGASVVVLTFGALGYTGMRYLVYQKLPRWLETQLSDILNRDVNVGSVTRFSFNSVQFDTITVPASTIHDNQLVIAQITTRVNLWPLLQQQPIPVDFQIASVQGTATQAADGRWLDLDVADIDIPLDLDIGLEIIQGTVQLTPRAITNQTPVTQALQIDLQGKSRYLLTEQRSVTYDWTVAIAQSQLVIAGETVLATGKTQAEIAIERLNLPELVGLMADFPVTLTDGQLQSHVVLNWPTWDQLTALNSQGNIAIEQLSAQIPPWDLPLKADIELIAQGQTLQIQTLNLWLNQIQTQVTGSIDWEKGYDLTAQVQPFELGQWFEQTGLKLQGQLQANMQLHGPLAAPQLMGTWQNVQPIRWDQLALQTVQGQFQVNGDRFVIPEIRIRPMAGGDINGHGVIALGWQQVLMQSGQTSLPNSPLVFDFQADLPIQKLAQPYYDLPNTVAIANVKAQGKLRGTLGQPTGLLQWQLPATNIVQTSSLSGGGQVVWEGDQLLLRNTQLQSDRSRLQLTGRANLKTQNWQTYLTAQQWAMTPFLAKSSNLPDEVTLVDAQVDVQGRLDELTFDQLQGKANLALTLNEADVQLKSQWADGQVEATASLETLDLKPWLKDLKLPVAITFSQAQFNAPIPQVLSLLTRDPQLHRLTAEANMNLVMADGQIQTQFQLQQGRWQTQIAATEINLPQVLAAVDRPLQVPWFQLQRAFPSAQLAAEFELSGNLNTSISEGVTVQAHRAELRMGGEQFLAATGEIDVTEILSGPTLARVDLAFNARTNFDALPGNRLSLTLPLATKVAPTVNLAGQSQLTGQIIGHNLQHPDLGHHRFWLAGQLQLTNFAVNGFTFDPEMAGRVRIDPARLMAIDLRGQADVLSASVEPCDRPRCFLSYWPVALTLQLGQDSDFPLGATGHRQGDRFLFTLDPFALEALNLRPGSKWGVPSPLRGQITAEVAWDLGQGKGTGALQIENGGLGYLQTEHFTSEIALDLSQSLVRINDLALQLAQSQLALSGQVNWQTGAIAGQLAVPQGQIADLFALLPWSTIEDYLVFRQQRQFAPASALGEAAIAPADDTLTSQLNLHWHIEQYLRQLSAQRRKGGIPQQLPLSGPYQAEVELAGTWHNPQVTFQLAGQRWAWDPYPPFPAIIDPLGLVLEQAQVIPIEQVTVRGHYADQELTFEQAALQSGDTAITLTGTFAPDGNDANFEIHDLSLDIIYYFAKLPFDLSGKLNAQGHWQGNWAEPDITTVLALEEVGINGRFLNESLVGDLNYQAARFTFQTRESNWLDFSADVPFPIRPQTNDHVAIALQLDADAFAQLESFFPGEWVWSTGQGALDLQIDGRLEPGNWVASENWHTQGQIQLQGATLDNPQRQSPLVLDGNIHFSNDRFHVEQLVGQAPGIGLEFTVQGMLPLLAALDSDDSDSIEPLTIAIAPSQLALKERYEGALASELIIQGSLIRPEIGGWIQLGQGRFSVPNALAQVERVSPVYERWVADVDAFPQQIIQPQLDDLQIIFNDLALAQTQQLPTYHFRLTGDVTLNGALNDLNQIQPDGAIQITRGSANLFTTKVYFVRQHENWLTFAPELGLLNPQLDLQMKFSLSDVTLQVLNDNEIPDDIVRSGRTKTVEMTVDVEGYTAQLFPRLGQDLEALCQLRPANLSPLPATELHDTNQLNSLEQCIQISALEPAKARQLLTSPIITFRSNPPLSSTEIFALLGDRSPQAFDALRKQNSAQLVNVGLGQVAVIVAPGLQDIVFELNNAVTNLAAALGIQNLTAYPAVNLTFPINEASSVSATYDYIFNEGIIEYQLRF